MIDTAHSKERAWRRTTVATVAGTVLFLLLIEAGLRCEPVYSHLPPPDAYYQPSVDIRDRVLQHVLEEHGSIDVLFIGSSVVRTNIKPLEFDQLVADAEGGSWVSFNGGLSEIKPDAVHLYLENLWLRRTTPRIVVQGIRYVEIRDELKAADYKPFSRGKFEPLWLKPTLLNRLKRFVLTYSRLLYYQGVLRKKLLYFPEHVPEGYGVDSRGYSATKKTLSEARAENLIDEIWAYENAWEGETYPVSFAALEATATLCRERGITYILLNMPEHPDRFLNAASGTERYAAYLQLVRDFAEANDIAFIDLTEGDVLRFANPDWFSDGHHFSPAGASEFTRRLATHMAKHYDLEKEL